MSIPWLKELEERIQQTSERLRDLREENTTQKERIGELESELEAASPGDGEAEAWTEERDEIRTRVEKLVKNLESLLEDDA